MFLNFTGMYVLAVTHCRAFMCAIHGYSRALPMCAVKVLVTQLCPTLSTPVTVAHQASLSMGFSRHGVSSLSSLHSHLPHCRQILDHLSHQGSAPISHNKRRLPRCSVNQEPHATCAYLNFSELRLRMQIRVCTHHTSRAQ